MFDLLKNIKFYLEFIRCFPHLIIFMTHKKKVIINYDIKLWLKKLGKTYGPATGLIYLLSFKKEFRNLFYFRVGNIKYFLNCFCPQMQTLIISDEQNIGEGLFICHGFATGITSKSIGRNCTIFQQVTIGNTDGCPTILDNVTVYAGAIIIGDVTIGNNSVIGANSTIYRDVPDNCTVFPSTSRSIRWQKPLKI
jgi:serine O-acetyltransferase